MLKTLLKKQLRELFQNTFIDKKTGKARSKNEILRSVLLTVTLFIILGAAFYSMASGIAQSILGHGADWLYFSLTGLLSMALGVLISAFSTYASLYLPKDNDLLLSLPIPPRTLVVSRLCGVYFMSLLYTAWFWIPSLIAFWVFVPPTLANVLLPVLLTLIIALFVTVLSCLLGFAVALIASKTKGKSYLTVLISILAMGLYYIIYFRILNSLEEIGQHLDEVTSAFESKLHYIALLGKAGAGDFGSFLIFTVITLVLAVVCLVLLSRTFSSVVNLKNGAVKASAKEPGYRQKTPSAALLSRELKHFTSVSTWLLNGGFGLLILLFAAAAAVIKADSLQSKLSGITSSVPMLTAAFPVIALMAACVVLNTNTLLSVSISVEGNTLWILQTLPVDAWEILHAKERMCVRLCLLPGVLFLISMGTVFSFSGTEMILVLADLCIYLFLMADFELCLNLKNPSLSWTNIAYLIKQSMPVVINLFGGWVFCTLLIIGGIYLCDLFGTTTVLVLYGVIFLVLFLFVHHWLKTKGTEILRNL